MGKIKIIKRVIVIVILIVIMKKAVFILRKKSHKNVRIREFAPSFQIIPMKENLYYCFTGQKTKAKKKIKDKKKKIII